MRNAIVETKTGKDVLKEEKSWDKMMEFKFRGDEINTDCHLIRSSDFFNPMYLNGGREISSFIFFDYKEGLVSFTHNSGWLTQHTSSNNRIEGIKFNEVDKLVQKRKIDLKSKVPFVMKDGEKLAVYIPLFYLDYYGYEIVTEVTVSRHERYEKRYLSVGLDNELFTVHIESHRENYTDTKNRDMIEELQFLSLESDDIKDEDVKEILRRFDYNIR